MFAEVTSVVIVKGGGKWRRKERKGRGKKKFRLFSYEVNQNCKAPGGQNHRPFALFVQLVGRRGNLKEREELVSCSLKLTTLFFLGPGLDSVCVLRQCTAVIAQTFEEIVHLLSLWCLLGSIGEALFRLRSLQSYACVQ